MRTVLRYVYMISFVVRLHAGVSLCCTYCFVFEALAARSVDGLLGSRLNVVIVMKLDLGGRQCLKMRLYLVLCLELPTARTVGGFIF